MGSSERVFMLEAFGDVCRKIGYYLLKNKDMALALIYKNTKLSKKDAIKGLSLLIHFKIVGFTNYSGRGTRYFINHKYLPLNSYPVYIDYAEKKYGEMGSQLAMKTLIRGRIEMRSIPSDIVECARRMIKDGVLQEESVSGLKRVKEDTDKHLVFSTKRAGEKILNQIFDIDILKYFSETTKNVFIAVRSFYPMPSTFAKVLERYKELGLQSKEHEEEKNLEAAIQNHLKYLIGYGAVSGGYEMYQINQEQHLNKIKKKMIFEYCDMYIGSNASTILSMLLDKGYVEDKFIQKYLLIEMSECKKVLFALLSNRFVSMQMIPRTADCASSKSFHLWSANIQKIHLMVKKKVHEKINNSYVDLAMLQENKLFIMASEYKQKADCIYNALEKLHLFCFVLGL